ncbi:MAG: NADPH-dependent glutamate synthase, partial [Nitrospirae bacterium]|nr:NADPH-dependent glutamate synthase [Nitrospirota bacterium]
EGCPVNVPIRDFIGFINKGDFSGAINKIKEQNFLPAVCGRVCPQEDQCEKNCVVGKKNEPVGIGRLERFAADWERTQGTAKKITVKNPTGKKVAIVGSGPSGLTAAFDLAKEGHKVTIFEALHQAGGVLVYGIPEFRLPKSIVAKEIETLKEMGVEIALNSVIGKLFTVDELMKDFDACYIGTGAGLPKFMGIPGENLNGVYSANEFLTRANLMKAFSFPEYDTPIRTGKRLAVVGGGNVAMDSARTALRLGLEESMIIYRRSLAEMPARAEEVHHAKEEGVRFEMLTNPIRIIGKDGWVNAIECERMELGEPDASGRRKPVRIKGSEFQIAVDAVIIAVGTSANPLVPQSAADLKTTKWGYIIADEQTGLTSMKGVYAGGDIVTGSATVILAMGAGRKAASAISQYLAAK